MQGLWRSKSILVCLLGFLFLFPSFLYAQDDTPCECAERWINGGTWNNDGTVDESTGGGVVICVNAAGTQSNIAPNCTYDADSFEIDVSGIQCFDPSDGSNADPDNPCEGRDILWLNFDVPADVDSFEIQINDNNESIGWALYYSANPVADDVGQDCENLILWQCGVESSSTWTTFGLPVDNTVTNFYLAVWELDDNCSMGASPELGSLQQFKARLGCAEEDVPDCLTLLDVNTICGDGTYDVVLTLTGIGEYAAYDPNAMDTQMDWDPDRICLEGDTMDITLTYAQGTDYDIWVYEENSDFAMMNGNFPGNGDCETPEEPNDCAVHTSGSVNCGGGGAGPPNCVDITASINEDGKARLTLNDLLTICYADVDYLVKIQNIYGAYLSQHDFDCNDIIELDGCAYIRQGLKISVSTSRGTCWSNITFHHPDGPIIHGDEYHLWCLDPAIASWEEFLDKYDDDPIGGEQFNEKYDEWKRAIIPCEGDVHADFVADWIVPFPCDEDPQGDDLSDTLAKIIYREWEAYDKYGNRGVGFDTIYVYKIPTIYNYTTYCPERDTLYCGLTSEKFGPYILAPQLGEDGTISGTMCDTLCLVKVSDTVEAGYLVFKPMEFDPKCGVTVNVKQWNFDSHCDNNYKVAVSLKQTCPGFDPSGRCEELSGDYFEEEGANYWECEFWVTDLDTAKPIVECKLDHFQDQSIIPGSIDEQVGDVPGGVGSEVNEDHHCFRMENDINAILEKPWTVKYKENDAYKVYEDKEVILIPTGTHECAAHVTIPPVCAWDDWSGIKQVKARVFSYHDVVIPDWDDINQYLADLGPDNPYYPDITGHESNDVVLENLDGSNDDEIKARNLRKIKGAYYKYRWVISDALENGPDNGTGFGIMTNESIATVLLNDNGEDCTIYDRVWDPDAGDYGDCIDVEGDCYSDDKTIKLPYNPYPYVIVYEGVDYCHNKYYELCYIYVKDKTKPIIAANKGVTVSLTDKKAWVEVEHLDEGSWDNCDINFMLARRTDWWSACVELEYDTCWIGHHDDIIYEFKLDNEKDPFEYTKQVEAHYTKVLEWLRYDGIPCGITIYNSWKYDLLKKATQYKDPTVTDEYFRKIFEVAFIYEGDCVDFPDPRLPDDCGDNGQWKPLHEKFAPEPPHPTFNCDEIPDYSWYDFDPPYEYEEEITDREKGLIDTWEQIGGGWSDQVPFGCEDACGPVTVELLVMDYWCNWGKVWTNVWVEDRTPISIENDVSDEIDITCNTYKNEKIYDDPSGGIHPVSLEAIVNMAQAGQDEAYDALDAILGGYCKVWRDPYGNWVDEYGEVVETDIDFVDYTCTCTTEAVRRKFYDEHLGYIWKLDTISDCYYLEDEEVFQKGIVVVNCAENVQCDQSIWSEFDHCGQGVIYRKFKIWQGCPDDPNDHQVDTIYRVQTIWVGNECPQEDHFFEYLFDWPYDTIVETCGIMYDDAGNVTGSLSPEFLGEPVYTFDDDCRIVGIGYEDEVYKVVGGDEGCYKIVRTWYAQDWCGKKPVDKYWWRNRDAVFVEWEQKILVIDTEAPSCTITGPVEAGGEITAAGCYYNFRATVDVEDACGLLTYYWELKDITDVNNIKVVSSEGPNEIEGVTETSFEVAVDDLETGAYKLQVRIQDDCQNEQYCAYEFTILAGKKPQIICVTSTTAELNPMDPDQDGTVDTGQVFVWAVEIISSYIPACNDTAVYAYIELVEDGQAPTFDGDEMPYIELGCEHIGPQIVAVWLQSLPSGTTDYCEVMVVVQDNNGACGEASSLILGDIVTELQESIEQVEVTASLEDGQVLSWITDRSGIYAFAVALGQRIVVTPKKDIEDLNGVSTLDMVKILKHILGKAPLENKYRIRAADVNADGKISPIDLIEIRKLILRKIDQFTYSDSWRFYSVDTDKERYVIDPLVRNMELDWIGVKIGDVNMDNDPSRSAGRVNKSLVFTIEDAQMIAGSQYKVTLQTSNFTDIIGYQFTLQSDPSAVKIVGVEFNEGMDISEENFNLNRISQGVITTSWNTSEGISMPAGDDVFTLVLEAQKNSSLSEVMTINSAVTKAEAYNSADQLHDVSLNFNGTAVVEAGFALYQNEPNPFKESTVIKFSLPESMGANITIYDVTGQVVKVIEGDFPKGHNQVTFNADKALSNGVYYYQLDTENFINTRKMIILH